MTTKRVDSCTGKRQFVDRTEAEAAIPSLLEKGSAKLGILHPYPCEGLTGEHWHIGHHKNPGRKWL